MTKIKTNEIPGRAKHLFIKLYCEKKGGETTENIHNAAQSWLSLSHKKKQHFYETVSTKSVIKKGQLIIQTEPYLKAKFPSIASKRNQNHGENQEQQNENTDDLHGDTIMECDSYSNSFAGDNNVDDTLPETSAQDIDSTLQERAEGCESQPVRNETLPITCTPLQAEDSTLHERAEESVLEQTHNETQRCEAEKHQNSFLNIIDIDEETLSANEDDMNENNAVKVPLQEPVLPVAKSGKDLFELLKSRNGLNKTYESLTGTEKRFYGHAVRTIKRNYVQKYKEYLESLPSRQLFDYYRKVFF